MYKGSLSPRPHQHLLLIDFLMTAILKGVKSYLIIVLTYISLIINNFVPLFMYLLSISMSSLDKCLFKSSVCFQLGYFFYNTELHELFIYFENNPLSVTSFANTFSHSVGCVFVL